MWLEVIHTPNEHQGFETLMLFLLLDKALHLLYPLSIINLREIRVTPCKKI